MEKGKEGKCAQGDVLSPCGSLAVFSCEAKLAEKMGGICFFFHIRTAACPFHRSHGLGFHPFS